MTPDPYVRGLGLGMRLEGRGREEGEEGGEGGEGGKGRREREGEGGRGRRERGWRREVERSETHMLTWMQNGRIDFLLLSAPLVSTKSPQDCHNLGQRTASYHTTKCSCA